MGDGPRLRLARLRLLVGAGYPAHMPGHRGGAPPPVMSAVFSTLPISLRGNSSRKRTLRGRLCEESRLATWSISSFSVGWAPGKTTTQATIRSPRSSSRLARRRRLGHGGVLEQRSLDLAGAHAVPPVLIGSVERRPTIRT